MNGHTPEPWYATEEMEIDGVERYVGSIGRWGVYGNGFTADNNEADARRIVACVNACAGLATEALAQEDIVHELLRGCQIALPALRRDRPDWFGTKLIAQLVAKTTGTRYE